MGRDYNVWDKLKDALTTNRTGWQCPICKAVNAPWVEQCSCSAPVSDCKPCPHLNVSIHTVGTICEDCGATL
jgi:hypothetical protein